jgi:hypothetical protein
VARESRTWASAAYLLLHFPLGLAYFVSLVVLLALLLVISQQARAPRQVRPSPVVS